MPLAVPLPLPLPLRENSVEGEGSGRGERVLLRTVEGESMGDGVLQGPGLRLACAEGVSLALLLRAASSEGKALLVLLPLLLLLLPLLLLAACCPPLPAVGDAERVPVAAGGEAEAAEEAEGRALGENEARGGE